LRSQRVQGGGPQVQQAEGRRLFEVALVARGVRLPRINDRQAAGGKCVTGFPVGVHAPAVLVEAKLDGLVGVGWQGNHRTGRKPVMFEQARPLLPGFNLRVQ
jgi:hypothetical protein